MTKTYPTVNPRDLDLWLSRIKELGAADAPAVQGTPSAKLSKDLSKLQERLLEAIAQSEALGLGKDETNSVFELKACFPFKDFVSDLSRLQKMDPGFWAYLGFTLFDVISWRHPILGTKEPAQNRNFGSAQSQTNYFLLVRLFLRASLAGTPGIAAMGDQDLWNSHIIRVRTSHNPHLVRALLERSKSDGLSGSKIREQAKRIQRQRANILTEILDYPQSVEFLDRVF
jgi:hypothetical protein